jgi:outer membrane immunogenic protein
MRTIALGLLAGSAAFAVPAMAQDVNPNFTGPRVGVVAGYDAVRPGSSEDSDIDGDDQTVDGFLYGVDVGYDFAVSGAVLGVEAELTDSTGKTKTNTSDPEYFGYGRVAPGRDIYVGVRAGVLATPQTLVYAKAGYTNAKLNVQGVNGDVDVDRNYELDGYRVGAGVEQSIGTNTYAKLEYRYSNYSSADFRFGDGSTTDSFDVDTDRHQVLVGVGMRF